MVAENTVQFDNVLALAYRLTRREKIKLVKRMADALEHESALTTDSVATPALSNDQTWGEQALAVLDSFDFNDWQAIDMPDVVEWVKQQRTEQERKRGILWEGEE